MLRYMIPKIQANSFVFSSLPRSMRFTYFSRYVFIVILKPVLANDDFDTNWYLELVQQFFTKLGAHYVVVADMEGYCACGPIELSEARL